MKRLVLLTILLTVAMSATGCCRRGCRMWRRGAPCGYYAAPVVQPTYAVPTCPTPCPSDPCACPPASTVPSFEQGYAAPTVIEGAPVYNQGAAFSIPDTFAGQFPGTRAVVVDDRRVEPHGTVPPSSTTTAAKE